MREEHLNKPHMSFVACTEQTIIFSGSSLPKDAICYDIHTPTPQKLHDMGC
jgi:hypothetical protein